MKTITHIGQLQPDTKNARKHNPRNIGMIEDSLHEVGAARSIVIDETGRILAGNGTIEAAASAGIERVQVVDADGETIIAVRRTGLTEAQKTRLALFDNQTAATAEWDSGVLAGMAADGVKLDDLFVQDELDALLAGLVQEPEPGDGGDEFDTTPAEGPTVCQPGQLWALGPHRLLCGDSTKAEDVARLMCGAKAGAVVTSPPYNQSLDSFKPSGMQKENPAWVNRMASSYADSKPESEYQDEQAALLDMLFDHTTPTASVMYNHKHRYRGKAVVCPMDWIRRTKWVWRQEVIWDRSSSITLNARMFMPCDERIYWLTKGDFVFNDTTEIKAWSTIWPINPKAEAGVSAPFPVELPERCINAVTKPGDVVIEPYCGSGTTLIAAQRTGRKCYGIEIDPKYCDVVIRRYEAETGDTARLVD